MVSRISSQRPLLDLTAGVEPGLTPCPAQCSKKTGGRNSGDGFRLRRGSRSRTLVIPLGGAFAFGADCGVLGRRLLGGLARPQGLQQAGEVRHKVGQRHSGFVLFPGGRADLDKQRRQQTTLMAPELQSLNEAHERPAMTAVSTGACPPPLPTPRHTLRVAASRKPERTMTMTGMAASTHIFSMVSIDA